MLLKNELRFLFSKKKYFRYAGHGIYLDSESLLWGL